jgi:hypothetical protein
MQVMGRQFSVPAVDDCKLLWACLAWPTSCYVSDATNPGSATVPSGQFWWRVPLR